MMRAAFVGVLVLMAAGFGLADAPKKPEAEARALTYLAAEVPRWSRENHCFSCHNNGDAARALFVAPRLGFEVPDRATAATAGWLARPSRWDHNGGEGPFSDKRLARVAFTAALAEAARAGAVRDRGPLVQAARRLAADQSRDGSWTLDGEDAPGAPAAYGRTLATRLARDSLEAAGPEPFRDAITLADTWLAARPIDNTADAAVALMDVRSTASDARRKTALNFLARAQSDDGGWGPFAASPPEVFDTAIALLGLARSGDRTGSTRRMIAHGRAFLIVAQHDDGSWTETTRPPGGTSYAQRISTTGWAALALLATREAGR